MGRRRLGGRDSGTTSGTGLLGSRPLAAAWAPPSTELVASCSPGSPLRILCARDGPAFLLWWAAATEWTAAPDPDARGAHAGSQPGTQIAQACCFYCSVMHISLFSGVLDFGVNDGVPFPKDLSRI